MFPDSISIYCPSRFFQLDSYCIRGVIENEVCGFRTSVGAIMMPIAWGAHSSSIITVPIARGATSFRILMVPIAWGPTSSRILGIPTARGVNSFRIIMIPILPLKNSHFQYNSIGKSMFRRMKFTFPLRVHGQHCV